MKIRVRGPTEQKTHVLSDEATIRYLQKDASGHLLWERWPAAGKDPRPLSDFSILPDQVSYEHTLSQHNVLTKLHIGTEEQPW